MSENITIVGSWEETTAWKRRIHLNFNGKPLWVSLAWSEWDGFELIMITADGASTLEDVEAFKQWATSTNTDGEYNYYLLDELTS